MGTEHTVQLCVAALLHLELLWGQLAAPSRAEPWAQLLGEAEAPAHGLNWQLGRALGTGDEHRNVRIRQTSCQKRCEFRNTTCAHCVAPRGGGRSMRSSASSHWCCWELRLPCPALQQGTVTGAAAGPVCLAALLTHHSLLDLGVLQRETNGFLKNLIQGSSFKFFFCLSQLQQILLKVAAEPDGKATY